MTTTKQKLVLFDGSSLAFRAFYAIQNVDSFTNKNGLHTNALYTFHRMLTKILEDEKPDYALVAWDAGKTTFRTEKYADYKGGRKSAPDEFREQMPYFNVMLDAFGIAHYELANYEADDIIGTLAFSVPADTFDVVIISGDKDLTQLAREHITVKLNRRGATEMEDYTPATVQDKYGLAPEQIVDLKGLMGDSSDNYPGVTGIGEKTALKLLHDYETAEGVYDHIDDISGKKRREHLIEDKDQAFLSKDLARIRTDAPITVTIDDIQLQPRDEAKLRQFYEDMNFNQFLSEMGGESSEAQTASVDVPEYQVVTSADELTDAMFSDEPRAFYTEMLEKNYHEGTMLAAAWGDDAQIYVADVDVILASEAFKDWLQSNRPKWVFDMKRQRVMWHYQDVQVHGVTEDVLIGSYLSHSEDLSNDIAQVASAEDISGFPTDDNVYGKGAKRAVPADKTAMYDHLAQKVRLIQQLVAIEHDHLKEKEMLSLYRDVELPLADVLADMEEQGVHVDGHVLDELKVDFDQRLKELEAQIYEEAGHEFTINSTYQLSDVLYGEMGLPHGKKLKKEGENGEKYYSTAQGELEKLQGVPIIDLILNYRQISKLQSTYVSGLHDFIHDADQKIHTRFIQTLTATGRLSSADPNLQNIPIRSDEGRQIRRAFMSAHEDWMILSSDYSQIELRVLAHISGDTNLKQAFIDGKDIHSDTASRIMDVPIEEVTPNQRRQAKAVNFGIVYGISDYGLSQNIGIPRYEAKEFIDRYFETYPNVKKFMDDIVEKAHQDGYVETLYHRRRYLPDINNRRFQLRSFAERTAMNSPIQGTAADIIKIAMIRMQDALAAQNMQAKMLLQVHDELIFEVPKDEVEELTTLVKDVMENAVDWDVPLLADVNVGDTWYEAK
ncbi:MAG: DNA polymerase I [Aerococcus sp.]|nr:DNA polymerase I [Aerococcus sp.]